MRSLIIIITGALASLAGVAATASANAANLLSGDVSISNDSPNLTTVYAGPASGPTTSTINLVGYTFTFTADTFTYTNPYSGPYTSVGPTGFNGFVLVFSGAPTITNVTNDPSSQLDPSNISFTGNSIAFNLNGLPRYPGEVSVFDVTTSAVPEPANYALMLAGLAAGAFAMRRRMRAPRIAAS